MSRRQTPEWQQQELEWQTRRGQELQALRKLDLHDSYSKLIVLMLDLCISQKTGFWDMHPDDLRRMCNMSRSTFYQRLKTLQVDNIVAIQLLPNSVKQRFRLYRGTIAKLASANPAAAVLEMDAVPVADSAVRYTDSPVRQRDEPVRHTDSPVRQRDDTTTDPTDPTDPTAPSESGDVGDADEDLPTEWVSVRQEIIAQGVSNWPRAIEVLRPLGVDYALAVIAFFRAHAQRNKWQPITLYFRLVGSRRGIAPDAAWPMQSASPGPASPQSVVDLEGSYGASLDALSLDQLPQLIQQDSYLRSVASNFRRLEQIRENPDCRRRLLALLAEKEKS